MSRTTEQFLDDLSLSLREEWVDATAIGHLDKAFVDLRTAFQQLQLQNTDWTERFCGKESQPVLIYLYESLLQSRWKEFFGDRRVWHLLTSSSPPRRPPYVLLV